eukprot:757937-Amphidinium_carterae.2
METRELSSASVPPLALAPIGEQARGVLRSVGVTMGAWSGPSAVLSESSSTQGGTTLLACGRSPLLH